MTASMTCTGGPRNGGEKEIRCTTPAYGAKPSRFLSGLFAPPWHGIILGVCFFMLEAVWALCFRLWLFWFVDFSFSSSQQAYLLRMESKDVGKGDSRTGSGFRSLLLATQSMTIRRSSAFQFPVGVGGMLCKQASRSN